MASDNAKWFVLLAIVLLYLSYTPKVLDGNLLQSLFNQPIIFIFAALAVLFTLSTK